MFAMLPRNIELLVHYKPGKFITYSRVPQTNNLPWEIRLCIRMSESDPTSRDSTGGACLSNPKLVITR